MAGIIRWYTDPFEGKDSDFPEVHEFETDAVTAWAAWRMLQVTQWKHLLVEGGILNQPEALWHDVVMIESVHRWYRKDIGLDRG